MKFIYRLLVFIYILFAGMTFAQDLNKSIQSGANNLRDYAATKEEARLLQTQFTQDDLTNKLLDALWNANSISVEDASKRLLFEMDPFPFEQIYEILIATDSSLKQAYLLSILNRGAKNPEQIAVTLKIAKSMLGNKGKGIRRYGEARAYSADGLRVCDIAYNILITRLSLVPSMPPVDVDNFSTDKRDALIVELAKRESIPLTASELNAVGSLPDTSARRSATGRKTSNKINTSDKRNEPFPLDSSSARSDRGSTGNWWSWGGFIAMIVGLAIWLFIKHHRD